MQVRSTEQHIGTIEPPATQTQTQTAERGTRRGQRGLWMRQPLLWAEALLGLYVLAVSASAMTGPLDRDEGAFLTIARVVLHGGLPYRDAFDQKSPAIYYLLAGLLAVTGWLSPFAQVLVIRAVVVLVNFATAGGLVLLGRRWWSLEVGVLGAALWLLGMPIFQGDHFFTEPFAVAATVFALVAVVYWPTARGALCAGVLLAIGSLFKQTAVLAVPGVALLLLPDWRVDRRWWRPRWPVLARLASFAAGLIVPWLLVLGAFALAGAFGPMWQQVVVSNITHYPADGTLRSRLNLGIGRLPLVWLTPVALAALGVARWIGWWPGAHGGRGPAPSPASVALWVIMALAAVPFATHSYAHYWLQLLPSAVLLTALAIIALLEVWRPSVPALAAPRSVPVRLLGPVVVLAIVLLGTSSVLPTSQAKALGQQLQTQNSFGQVIAANTAPTDRIVVMPAEAEYYFLSNRAPATSTIYIQVINITPALIAGVENDLDAQRYQAVVWRLGPFNDWPQLAEVYGHLRAHYQLVAQDTTQGLQLWKPDGSA